MERYCTKYLQADLQKKMVFIGGPRQVGKTTLSKSIAETTKIYQYFNWDVDEDRNAILKKAWRADANLVIFDELHKYPRWKQWIKGVYDSKTPSQQYLVTGSARLDIYEKGGDSLLGRYHYWRLHPLTIDELPNGMNSEEGYQRLLTLGGFPEPFLLADEREAKRWRRARFERILKEDIRDLEQIKQLTLLELFANSLRQRVGGLITLSNIAEDLQISPKTAKHWLSLLEKMYLIFPIYPYTKNLPRALQKPPKVYFYDNGDILNGEGARLENLVACTLLKRLHFREDYYGDECSLYYIRDKEKREVDFVTVINNVVTELIEVKTSDSDISTSLKYYADKLQPKCAIQLVGNLRKAYDKDGIQVRHPIEYFSQPIW